MRYQEIDIKVEETETGGYHPKLYAYLLDNSPNIDPDRKRPAVLICPGGGYVRTSDREAEPVAIQMNAMGFQAFVLRYSCAPAAFPIPQLEAANAIKLIRERAEEWNIQKNKVIILGFSAGGHLAASVGTFWNHEFLYKPLKVEPEMLRPNGMVLCYPVITSGEFAHQDSFFALLGEKKQELCELVSLEKQVSEETPAAFIWHTYEDGSVPVENSMLFASALRKKKIPFELHIYPRGGHGLALANEETNSNSGYSTVVPECQNWVEMAGRWIRELKG